MGLKSIIEQYEHWARSHDVPVSSADTRQLIATCLDLARPSTCVEIGTAVGLGTAMLAERIAQRDGSVVSFEISYPSYHQARVFIQSCHLLNSTLYHCDFLACPLERVLIQPVDFVFVDGMKSLYRQYFERCLPFSHDKTIIIFDDVVEHGNKVGDLPAHCAQHGRHTNYIATEPGDGVLVATKDQELLTQLLQKIPTQLIPMS